MRAKFSRRFDERRAQDLFCNARPAVGQMSCCAALLMIENVGNLVCPALFDLGAQAKVVILSVTEGEDKPIKYPHMFRASQRMLLNKIDLLPHLRFDVARCIAYACEVDPAIKVLQVSAETGADMPAWDDWLQAQAAAARQAGAPV